MKKNKFDGVLEAVRVDQNDQLLLAKIYEKRGVVWSDHFLVNREDFIQRIKNGNVFVVGTRQYKLGSSFETSDSVQLSLNNEQAYIRLDQENSPSDNLKNLPRF
ncbi:MAG: DUF3892 domain-containing protein [Anaerolineaceae bacterium]|jgi:hypothetical protein|nr:MAG: hypothetical protein CVU46_13180 [Chloroflexi bacterium HGW-Chloroflexi-8]